MHRVRFLWVLVFLIVLELSFHLYDFIFIYQPIQLEIKKTLKKLSDSTSSRSIYCIGDEHTLGQKQSSYPYYLNQLFQNDSKYQHLTIINLGLKNSNLLHHYQLIASLEPGSRIIFRGKVSGLLYKNKRSKHYLEKLKIVQTLRCLLSTPATDKRVLDSYFYEKFLSLIKKKQFQRNFEILMEQFLCVPTFSHLVHFRKCLQYIVYFCVLLQT